MSADTDPRARRPVWQGRQDRDGAATGSCQTPPPDLAECGIEAASKGLPRPPEALKASRFSPLTIEGQSGTLFATLDGTPVAVVPLDLYRRMVVGLAAAVSAPARSDRGKPPTQAAGLAKFVSTIQRDAEVATFLRDLFTRHLTLVELRTACLERFGEERTPSLNRIAGFRRRAT